MNSLTNSNAQSTFRGQKTGKVAIKVAKTRSLNAFGSNNGASFSGKQSKNILSKKYGASQSPIGEKRQRSKGKKISSPLEIESDGATFPGSKIVKELKINTESKIITARDTEVADMATSSSVVDPLVVGPIETEQNAGVRRRSLESARVVG